MSAERGRPAVVSALASERRARVRSALVAVGVSSRRSAISPAPRPSHSRITIAFRWFSGSAASAPGSAASELGLVRLGLGQRDPIELDVGRYRATTPDRSQLREAHVLRDRREPRSLALGLDAAPQRTERVEERRLERVLGVGA